MFRQALGDFNFLGFPSFLPPFSVLFLNSFHVQAGAAVVVAGPAVVVGAGGPAVVATVSHETAAGFHWPSLPH